MDEPIATYREARFELRRRFELYSDRIRVVGKGHSLGRFDTVVPLAILRPDPNRVWIRGQLFRYGLLTLSAVVFWSLAILASGGPEFFLRPWLAGVIGSLAGVGLMLALVNFQPIEFAGFQSDAGVIALDVGRVGPQTEDFDEFVDLLIVKIREAKPAT